MAALCGYLWTRSSGRSIMEDNLRPPKVFISYKWEDEAHIRWVEQLARDLRQRGIDALLDKWEVHLGESFSNYMASAISSSDAFLFIMTNQSVKAVESQAVSGAVRFEVQLANSRKIAGERFRFIGVLRQGKKVTAYLRDSRYIDFRDDKTYSFSLSKLVDELKGVSEKPDIPTNVDLNVVAEPIIHRIWDGLPHARSFLVEPASRKLQKIIFEGLLHLIKGHAENRGYRFNLVKIDLAKCNPRSFLKLLEFRMPSILIGREKSTSIRKEYPEIRKLYYQSRNKTNVESNIRGILVFSYIGQPNPSLETLLHEIRSWRNSSVLGRGLPIMVTTILLTDDLSSYHWDRRHCSLPWNIYERVKVDERTTPPDINFKVQH